MKKIITTIISICSAGCLIAQPVLYADSIHTGQSFNLYSLTGLTTPDLLLSGGANLTWNFSAATATLFGTADLLDMASTPYASQYPAANFAIKLTTGGSSVYSLFHLTSTVLEEVANNVGSGSSTTFIDYRTTLDFPFTFGSSTPDTYQKSGQAVKTITNHYDAYGTIITSIGTYNNVVRNLYNDDGTTSANCWTLSPMYPVFQASSSGFTLWKPVTITTGIPEIHSNTLFDMYPNPAANEISIINKELISKIDIFNMAGQLQFSTTKSTIDIRELSPGIYFIKAYSVKGIATEKFVKQ